MEKSLKVLSQIEETNINYDFLIKYLKFRMFTQEISEKREVDQRYKEGDLSSLLFLLKDESKAKPLNFASMIFSKELSKHPKVSQNCELKGKYFYK